MTDLNDYLRRFPAFDIGGNGILNAYVEIENYSDLEGRDMGSKNDLWIAVTATVHDVTLLTTDKDFNHLNGNFIVVEYIAPAEGDD